MIDPLVQEAEHVLCKRDRIRHIERHLTIKDKAGWEGRVGDHPKYHGLKPTQKKLLAILEECKRRNVPARVIVLKARKTGISTFIEADMFLETLERQIDSLVLAHDLTTAGYIFGITRKFYDFYDLEKLPTKKLNTRELAFQKTLPDGTETQAGLISVVTANNKQAGTGMTPQYIHASEPAKWEKGSTTAISLFQSIAHQPGTTVVLESTAYGYDSLFQPYWTNAEQNCVVNFTEKPDGSFEADFEVLDPDAWNGYIPYFIAWFDDEDNCYEFENDQACERLLQTLDLYEEMLVERYNVSPEALAWRRQTLKRECQDDIKIFQQEHPSTPQEAFVATGRPRLDHSKLNSQPIEQGRRVSIVRDRRGWARGLKTNLDDFSPLTVFREPIPNHRYVIGVDTATGVMPEGAKDPDATVCIVLDLDNGGEQVATFAGQISEEYLLEPLLHLGEFYNWAYIVPEVGNNNYLPVGLQQQYPQDKIYHETQWKDGMPVRKKAIGFKTHIGTRPPLITRLASFISEGGVILHDLKTIEECKRLVYTRSGRIEADAGTHDDHVFALALAITGMEQYPTELQRVQQMSNEQYKRLYKQARVSGAPKPQQDGYT